MYMIIHQLLIITLLISLHEFSIIWHVGHICGFLPQSSMHLFKVVVHMFAYVLDNIVNMANNFINTDFI